MRDKNIDRAWEVGGTIVCMIIPIILGIMAAWMLTIHSEKQYEVYKKYESKTPLTLDEFKILKTFKKL